MGARRTLVATAMAGVLALAGCAGSTGTTDQARPGSASGAADRPGPGSPSGAPPAAASQLDFTVATLDGATFEGASLAGRPAVLWFWAPWCPTCASQAPQVTDLAASYSGRAAVVGVAGLDKTAAMREFVARTKATGFPHLADEQGVVWKRFGVTAQSTFAVLDAKGTVVADGHLKSEELRAHLDRLGA